MSNKVYDVFKYIARYVLPALATMVITIFKIWGLPYGEEIGATIMAVDTALNIILGISSRNYYKQLEKGEE